MTEIPLWLAILFPTGSLVVGAFVASWAVYTWNRNQTEKRDAAVDAKISTIATRLETATDAIKKEVAVARETGDLKLSTAIEKESKSRHDAQNATAGALAALQMRFDAGMKETASRDEVRAIETRLAAGMTKLEGKMDQLSTLVPEMSATLKMLSGQVERLSVKIDGRKVPAE
ncbi:hypothetical protein [Roseomonas elaeocarpi]|uniref:Chemotaxis protein n=1 Tax=Roseomonas elaeocarpi TaxID=907779 RepID=A0ABV6JQA3_9PROT